MTTLHDWVDESIPATRVMARASAGTDQLSDEIPPPKGQRAPSTCSMASWSRCGESEPVHRLRLQVVLLEGEPVGEEIGVGLRLSERRDGELADLARPERLLHFRVARGKPPPVPSTTGRSPCWTPPRSTRRPHPRSGKACSRSAGDRRRWARPPGSRSRAGRRGRRRSTSRRDRTRVLVEFDPVLPVKSMWKTFPAREPARWCG